MKHIVTAVTTALIIALAAVTVGANANNLINNSKHVIGSDGPEAYREVRFVHAAPYAGPVDVWTNEGIIAKEFSYTQASDYIKSTEADGYKIYLAVSGTDIIVAEFNLKGLDSDKSHTVIVYNGFLSGSGNGIAKGLTAIVSADPEISGETGRTWLGAAHTAQDVGTVQFRLDSDLITIDPWVKFPNGAFTGFLKASTPNTLLVDVDFDRNADLTFSIPALPVDDYVYASVVSEPGGVFILAILSDGTVVKLAPDTDDPVVEESYVRILHLAPSAPDVDIFLNEETRAVESLGYAQSVGYVALPSGNYQVDIVPAQGKIDESVLTAVLDLKAGGSYTVVAHETGKGLALQVTLDARSSDSQILLTSDIRASHLIDILGPVDVYVTGNGENPPIIEKLTYGEPQGYLSVPAGQYTIGLDIDRDGLYDVSFTLPFLFPGEIADLYAALDGFSKPVIFTAVEDGGLFVSEANELKDVNPVLQ